MTNSNAVPCGIALPQIFVNEPVDMGLVETFAVRAEALGYDSLWVQERLIGGTNALEPLTLLSYVAALTNTIRIGTSVLIATTRNPVHLAKQVGTLDHISRGRLTLGLALGGRPYQYHLLDGPTHHRIGHFIESLEVMKALWIQPHVEYNGRFWNLQGEQMMPHPIQKPHPPIWFGGRHPDALKRAAQYGDGWMGAGSTTTAQFREHVPIIKQALEANGKNPDLFPISKRVYVALDNDEVRAERRLREWFERHYGSADLGSSVSVWGSEARVAEGLAEVVDAGARMLMINSVFDHMFHLETLRSSVLPKIHLPSQR
ncbi:LLM class flavin-dependent oxidoreductase [SAR202 cluster bacterium AD-804-J14_MRT_500m]|nr:LLM class flavin-dependent oxidoreductase [SAR202 cluster bacterium AD-804-J14_MRT_500m]